MSLAVTKKLKFSCHIKKLWYYGLSKFLKRSLSLIWTLFIGIFRLRIIWFLRIWWEYWPASVPVFISNIAAGAGFAIVMTWDSYDWHSSCFQTAWFLFQILFMFPWSHIRSEKNKDNCCEATTYLPSGFARRDRFPMLVCFRSVFNNFTKWLR